MSLKPWRVFSWLALTIVLAPGTRAQQTGPRIGYVYPAGGQQGTTFQVVIGGQRLTGLTNVSVSGDGVQAVLLERSRPLTPQEFREYLELKAKLEVLEAKRLAAMESRNWTPEDGKLLQDTKQRISAIMRKPAGAVRKPPTPALADIITAQFTVAPDAEPGQREVRVEGQTGVSNPLVFCVGQLQEFTENPSEAIVVNPSVIQKSRERPQTSAPKTEMTITLPATINGQVLPGEVNRYRFAATRGQRLVIVVSARQLIPYLSDAVPGWFQATLSLYDAQGREVAYNDDFHFNPDPVLYYEVPADSEYVIAIKDALYRGREDFVYRITLGELPFITSIFPLGGPVGARTDIELNGWNLPVTRVAADNLNKTPGIYHLSVRKDGHVSNLVPFAVDALPERLEEEPNDLSRPQRVVLPVIINGRVDQSDDTDVFQFDGKAGQQVVAEVMARRLNSPLDSALKLTDAEGKQIAFNDDHTDKGAGLTTHQADSWLQATLPADGSYYLHLGDTQQKGGAEYAYRLRISAPQPDFELRVTPSSVAARVGRAVPLTVYALRKDGFTGDITLSLKDAPEGFRLSTDTVSSTQTVARLTLTVQPILDAVPVGLKLEGRATIHGREVVHLALPAEEMTQAFEYRHLVPAKELKLALTGGYRIGPGIAKIVGRTPVRIPAGGTAAVRIAAAALASSKGVQFALRDPPKGIAIKSASPSREGVEILLESDVSKVKLGQKGKLTITASLEKPASAGKSRAPEGQRPLPVLPAIPFEITNK
ncbi:MAG: hypothetical protein N2689_02305 [Verrucomicrobiae bacterium]|nr:hypothetical protein [Verrucomicrobiae bacterium]